MSVQNSAEWQDLFVAGDQSSSKATINVSMILRSGQPLLILPADSKTASRALALYSAQTPKARLAKSLLALALKWNLPLRLPHRAVTVSLEEPFARFLAQFVGGRGLPRLAILSGNPKADGRRFVILVFNEKHEPAAVVKAGIGESAIRLVEDEASFLASVPRSTQGAPRLRETFRSPRVHALALDFLPGRSPDKKDEAGIEPLLTSWIDPNRITTIRELPAWQRLAGKSGPESPGWKEWGRLAETSCHPVIYHGDFAPWNIKTSNGVWQVLDWERGELTGVPGWDWFHYVIQGAVLIRREPVDALVERVERMLGSESFKRYVALAKINGMEQSLVLAYLNYSMQILRQTEELPRIQSLLKHLSEKWSDGEDYRLRRG
jgi:hypothetical protein